MKNINKSLDSLGKELANRPMLEYEQLPEIELYMEQLTNFLDRIFANYQIEKDEPFITQAMINNYVRGEVIPKPHNKRYNKDHLARIIEVALLKQVLELDDIKEVFNAKKKQKINKQYNDFITYFNTELQSEAKKMRSMVKKAEENNILEMYELATHYAIKAAINKMMADKIFKYIEIYERTKEN